MSVEEKDLQKLEIGEEGGNLIDQGRVGRFRIGHNILRGSTELISLLMARVLVVRAEDMFVASAIEYTAYSSLFEPVPKGQEIPHYDVIVQTGADDNGDKKISSISFEKRK